MSERRLLWGGLATAVGVGLILAGAATDSAYNSSVLGNLGTAVLLAVPLILLERAFEKTVKAAESRNKAAIGQVNENLVGVSAELHDVTGTVASLDHRLTELTERTRARVNAERDADLTEALGPVDRFLDAPSFATLKGAWDGTSRLYVALPEQRAILAFVSVWGPKTGPEGGVDVRFIPQEDDAPKPLHPRMTQPERVWLPTESVQDLFAGLDRNVRKALGEQYAPDLDAGQVIERLAQTLRTGIRLRAAEGDRAKVQPHLLALPTKSWQLLSSALKHSSEPDTSFPRKDVMEAGPHGAPLGDGIPDADQLGYAWLVAFRVWTDLAG